MTPESANLIALNAAAWLTGDADRLQHFFGATGADADVLRSGLENPVLLAAILDFVLLDDAWVLECASSVDIRPEDLSAARAALPGGELPHWT